MAKKRSAGKKPSRRVTTKTIDSARRHLGQAALGDLLEASAIVAQVVEHFGAGYGAQRQTESSKPPVPLQVFRRPSDLAGFHALLLESTLRNLAKINWQTDQPQRDAVCGAAFEHGVAARVEVVASGGSSLTIIQILKTLEGVQARLCPNPGGAGGGRVCDF